MRTFTLGASIFAVIATSVIGDRPAHACGGCFSPPAPREVTVVTGHRMAFSISPRQSVLWDQIEYSGSPQDFAWVLPVRAGATVQLSHDEFFAALDAMTNPVITGPTPNCGGGGGFGCGASGAGSADFASGGGHGVQVISQGVVGPYDTVTVRSTNPTALYDWLVANKYDIPASTRPIIDGYVSEGFDFLALRLAPGQGVQAMKPVRVVTPGAGLALPLRMVAAGVGANVGITLYVLGDGRYQAHNFPNGVVDASKLLWLHAQSQSNYEPLAEQTMQASGGRTWLTEFAQPVTLAGTADSVQTSGGYSCGSLQSGGSSYYNGFGGSLSLANYYFGQCLCLGVPVCPQLRGGKVRPDVGGGTADASLDALLEGAAPGSDDASEDAPSESAPDEAATPDAPDGDSGSAASAEGGAEGGGDDASGLTPPDAGCPSVACGGFDDLEVASAGLDPTSTWVTRMRAILPASALTEGDLVLEASPAQSPVSSQYTAAVYDDATYDPCAGGSGGGCATTDEPPTVGGRALVTGALAFLGFALVGRRRRGARRA